MYFQIFQDASYQWRWRLRAGNNQIVATSGESYTSKQNCRYAVDLVKSAWNAPVYEV